MQMRCFVNRRVIFILFLASVTCLITFYIIPRAKLQGHRSIACKSREGQKLRGIPTNVLRNPYRSSKWEENIPVIYVITATHQRLEQKADLTRLSQTLMHIKNLVWILVEDSDSKTNLVSRFLEKSDLSYIHLNTETPSNIKLKPHEDRRSKPKGGSQRNLALEWLRLNTSPDKHSGVVYFADDDNTYSLKVFDEMRYTKKVSVWPVGLVSQIPYERPLVKGGKVVDWTTLREKKKPFCIDMAGFAVNLKLFNDYPEASFDNTAKRGYQESDFLESLHVSLTDLEPKANMCSEVLAWHTQTQKSPLHHHTAMIALSEKLGGSYPSLEV